MAALPAAESDQVRYTIHLNGRYADHHAGVTAWGSGERANISA